MTSKWIPTWKNERLMSFFGWHRMSRSFRRKRSTKLSYASKTVCNWMHFSTRLTGWGIVWGIWLATSPSHWDCTTSRTSTYMIWKRDLNKWRLRKTLWMSNSPNMSLSWLSRQLKKNNCWVVRLSDREPVRRGSTWGWSLSVRHATRAPELFPKGRNKEKAVRFLSEFYI